MELRNHLPIRQRNLAIPPSVEGKRHKPEQFPTRALETKREKTELGGGGEKKSK